MQRIEVLYKKYIADEISVARFLERLELERSRVISELRAWWKSRAAYEACWNDLGGFDEQEYERRVADAFTIGYSTIVRRSLDPIFKHPTSEFGELALVIHKAEPYLLSDIRARLHAAETIEEVYFALGDDHSHWLVVYLVDHLREPSSVGRTR